MLGLLSATQDYLIIIDAVAKLTGEHFRQRDADCIGNYGDDEGILEEGNHEGRFRDSHGRSTI